MGLVTLESGQVQMQVRMQAKGRGTALPAAPF